MTSYYRIKANIDDGRERSRQELFGVFEQVYPASCRKAALLTIAALQAVLPEGVSGFELEVIDASELRDGERIFQP